MKTLPETAPSSPSTMETHADGSSTIRMQMHPRHAWRDRVSEDIADTLTTLSDRVKDAMDASAADAEDLEVGADDDFRSLWIGLLLGSGACSTYAAAEEWASWVRHNTDDLVA